jgi:2-octaprenylphenol hydroxylase
MDVQALAEEILRAQQRQLPVGDMTVLERYQRRRQGDNLAMMASMEGFKRLFAQPALPVRWLRNAGMRIMNKATPIKHKVMRQAMGL